MLRPVNNRITQSFGKNPQIYKQFGMKGHNGIDYGTPNGTPVKAALSGKVILVRSDRGGYGKHIKINHGGNSETIYAHLASSAVHVGKSINQGEVVGYSNNTGFSTGPHLHFGYRPNGYNRNNGYYGWVDPQPYIDKGSKPTPKPQPLKPKSMYAKYVTVEALRDFHLKAVPSKDSKDSPARGGLGSGILKGWLGTVEKHTNDWRWYKVRYSGPKGDQWGWVRDVKIMAVPNVGIQKERDKFKKGLEKAQKDLIKANADCEVARAKDKKKAEEKLMDCEVKVADAKKALKECKANSKAPGKDTSIGRGIIAFLKSLIGR